MGLLSSSLSVARYIVEGKKDDAIIDIVRKGLKENAISEIEDEYAEISTGWTPYESPFNPDFEKFSFTFGTYFVFSLRIDKKNIPAKIIQKHIAIEIAKRIKESNRDFISKNEKTDIKDIIIEKLMRQIPSTPNIYDVVWDYENSSLLFFTTQKAANEELETIFSKSFKQKIIKIFPFTMADKNSSITDQERDIILKTGPIKFSRL